MIIEVSNIKTKDIRSKEKTTATFPYFCRSELVTHLLIYFRDVCTWHSDKKIEILQPYNRESNKLFCPLRCLLVNTLWRQFAEKSNTWMQKRHVHRYEKQYSVFVVRHCIYRKSIILNGTRIHFTNTLSNLRNSQVILQDPQTKTTKKPACKWHECSIRINNSNE